MDHVVALHRESRAVIGIRERSRRARRRMRRLRRRRHRRPERRRPSANLSFFSPRDERAPEARRRRPRSIYSYGLYSFGLYSYGLHSYGL